MLVVDGVRGSVLTRSASSEFDPVRAYPGDVNHASRGVSVTGSDRWGGPPDQFDDVLVQHYGYLGNGRPLFPPHTPRYNKLIDLVYEPTCLRNIRAGKPAIAIGLHIGEVMRFQHRTFVYNFGGRRTNAKDSAMRVKGCHHEGKKRGLAQSAQAEDRRTNKTMKDWTW